VKICHALISINHNWQCFSEIREWWVSTFSVIQFSPGWRLETGQFSHYPLSAWPVMVTRQREAAVRLEAGGHRSVSYSTRQLNCLLLVVYGKPLSSLFI